MLLPQQPAELIAGLDIGTYQEDECLLRATSSDRFPRIRVYRPKQTAVVLGRGSDLHRELHLESCLADRVPLLRRRGGGCSVVIDPGNIIVSVVLAVEGIDHARQYFDGLTSWLIEGLGRTGFPDVFRDGISDLVRENRKVAGSCVYRTKGLLYYSATLLTAPNIEKIERYLQHPPREPDYRQGRRHSEFVGRLIPAGTIKDVENFAAGLRKNLPSLDLVNNVISLEKKRKITQLAEASFLS